MSTINTAYKIVVDRIAFTCDGHRYVGTRREDMTAFHSGRPLYRVKCETCNVEIIEGTTSTDPSYWIRTHDAEIDPVQPALSRPVEPCCQPNARGEHEASCRRPR